ncbi:MAG: hypothetical protein DMG13_18365 [Acidobacteria bacterium]|nr:MAG: hypothetical protein DMG13_18365 [Acidobacteriota bacterium]
MDNVLKNRVLLVSAATVVLLMISIPMLAHHGTNISYDRTKAWTKKAVVTEFRYANPHPQLFIDITDDKGSLEHWGAELLPNPAQLIKNGWGKKRSEEALWPGTTITVTIAPSKAGGTVGLLLKAVNEKGEELVPGGGGGGATPAP